VTRLEIVDAVRNAMEFYAFSVTNQYEKTAKIKLEATKSKAAAVSTSTKESRSSSPHRPYSVMTRVMMPYEKPKSGSMHTCRVSCPR
jgi:hypothetical protein